MLIRLYSRLDNVFKPRGRRARKNRITEYLGLCWGAFTGVKRINTSEGLLDGDKYIIWFCCMHFSVNAQFEILTEFLLDITMKVVVCWRCCLSYIHLVTSTELLAVLLDRKGNKKCFAFHNINTSALCIIFLLYMKYAFLLKINKY